MEKLELVAAGGISPIRTDPDLVLNCIAHGIDFYTVGTWGNPTHATPKLVQVLMKYLIEIEIGCLTSHATIFQLYMGQHIDMQAD